MSNPTIPYQSNDQVFFIRKIRANFDAASIDEHPHRHAFHEFLYIKSGEGKHEIDGITYELSDHTIYVISKGQVHNFLVAKNVEGFLIRFKDVMLPSLQSEREGFYHNLLFSLRQQAEIQIPEEDQVFVEFILMRALDEFEKDQVDLYFIQHLIYPLLILMNRYLEKELEAQDHEQGQYLKFIQLLDHAYQQAHDLQFYAESLGVSKRNLSRICQEKAGKTAKALIIEHITTESKRMMRYTSLPLKEIAFQLGFKDVAYFSRFFKKATDMTPREYRGNTSASSRIKFNSK